MLQFGFVDLAICHGSPSMGAHKDLSDSVCSPCDIPQYGSIVVNLAILLLADIEAAFVFFLR